MPIKAIKINREALTIEDVTFPDLEILELTADVLSSSIFIDYQPTTRTIGIILSYFMGDLSLAEVRALAKGTVCEH